ncbi:hypothetical protein, partial [Escherichia coli]|uniref:hypothetical protein n=1 Tax=Escherichia coli TaxID=562 RepID=UPI00195488A7
MDMRRLITTVVSVANERRRPKDATIQLDIETPTAEGDGPFAIVGHDSRLGQVVNNLLDNARSFSPPDAK